MPALMFGALLKTLGPRYLKTMPSPSAPLNAVNICILYVLSIPTYLRFIFFLQEFIIVVLYVYMYKVLESQKEINSLFALFPALKKIQQ